MECNNNNKFNALNFNLKNEIFSFFEAKETISLSLICKKFKFSINKLKWFIYIKENFDNLLKNSSLIYSEMNGINNMLIKQGASKNAAFYICLYINLLLKAIFNDYFKKNQ